MAADGLPGPGSFPPVSHNLWAFLMIMCEGRPTKSPIPRWLRRAYCPTVPARHGISQAAPVLAVLSPWPTITAVLW